jgi:hypothetical protein
MPLVLVVTAVLLIFKTLTVAMVLLELLEMPLVLEAILSSTHQV